MGFPLSASLILLACALLPRLALARSDEQKLAEAIAPFVRKVDRGFTLFHWEPSAGEFADKFNPDTPAGLLALTKAASSGFVENEGKHGFYAATDPVLSRFYGRNQWRLIQVQVPAGFKYLDLTDHAGAIARARKALAHDEACLSNIFVGSNLRMISADGNDALARRCTSLKRRLLKRLGVSAVKYSWLSPTLGRFCSGDDRSAFIFTDGAWLSSDKVKGYTAASTGDLEDRKAIQELLLHIPPPKAYITMKPAPLWGDLPSEGKLSAETRAWMNQHLLNCQDKAVVDSGRGESDADPEMESGAE